MVVWIATLSVEVLRLPLAFAASASTAEAGGRAGLEMGVAAGQEHEVAPPPPVVQAVVAQRSSQQVTVL